MTRINGIYYSNYDHYPRNPYNWRFWWDFGTGDTGNWGCHILDIPYWALGLKFPTKVALGEGGEWHEQTTPRALATTFTFPGTGDSGGRRRRGCG